MNERYYMLTALHRVAGTRADIRCRCACGNEVTVRHDNLRLGRIKSCGCATRDKALLASYKEGSNLLEHADKRVVTPEEKFKNKMRAVHGSMLGRCYTPTNTSYPWYGARGVTVAPEWHTFKTFFAWVQQHYVEGHWLDRIDNNGPYAPWNCTYRTPKQQGRNRRNNRLVTNGTETKPLLDVLDMLGIPHRLGENLYKQRLEAGENPPHFSHFQALAQKHAQPS